MKCDNPDVEHPGFPCNHPVFEEDWDDPHAGMRPLEIADAHGVRIANPEEFAALTEEQQRETILAMVSQEDWEDYCDEQDERREILNDEKAWRAEHLR